MSDNWSTKNGFSRVLVGDELKETRKIFKNKASGRGTARELHGEDWWRILRPRRYGRLFRNSVENGLLPNVRLIGRKSNRSLFYEVSGPADA